jgi:RNA polymerase sigma factor (sigma-70 family)
MSGDQPSSLVRYIRKLVGIPVCDLSDQQLLQEFIARRDETAFHTLVDRHGPLVRGVCLRVLGNLHDADDAFQAAFLVLARQANSIRRQESLASWLHGVAQRIAHKLRLRAARRRLHETAAGEQRPVQSTDDMTLGELKQVLDEEIAALPDKYRAPVILCCLEGKARDEVAQELGWSVGSVKGRLERGRELLRTRLARRGLALSTALFVLTGTLASAAVPPSLAAATAGAAAKFAAGQPLAGLVSPQTIALTDAYLHGTLLAKVKMAALAAVLLLGTFGSSLGAIYLARPGQQPAGDSAVIVPRPATPTPVSGAPPPSQAVADVRPASRQDPLMELLPFPEPLDEPLPAEKPPARANRSTAIASVQASGGSSRAFLMTISRTTTDRRTGQGDYELIPVPPRLEP